MVFEVLSHQVLLKIMSFSRKVGDVTSPGLNSSVGAKHLKNKNFAGLALQEMVGLPTSEWFKQLVSGPAV